MIQLSMWLAIVAIVLGVLSIAMNVTMLILNRWGRKD
jgi:hypothetical protein